jgi:hypothetical protein
MPSCLRCGPVCRFPRPETIDPSNPELCHDSSGETVCAACGHETGLDGGHTSDCPYRLEASRCPTG